jgi:hypothetical protein
MQQVIAELKTIKSTSDDLPVNVTVETDKHGQISSLVFNADDNFTKKAAEKNLLSEHRPISSQIEEVILTTQEQKLLATLKEAVFGNDHQKLSEACQPFFTKEGRESFQRIMQTNPFENQSMSYRLNGDKSDQINFWNFPANGSIVKRE